MNKLLLKQVSVLSIIAGIAFAILTLIPFIGTFAFMTLICLVSAIIIILMVKLDLLEVLAVRESVVLGAFIGFIAFMAFAVVYLPIVALLGRFFNLTSLYGISLVLNVGSFGITFLLTVFVAILSATINAFSAFITFYLVEYFKINDKNSNDNDKFNLR